MGFLDMISATEYARMAVLAFFAILFLQSGIDKVTDRKGNLDWMIPHFEKSLFKGQVPILLSIVTLVEIVAGLSCVFAMIQNFRMMIDSTGTAVLLQHDANLASRTALAIVSFAILQLFLGQRLAKDYVGAASLSGYFAVAVVGFYFTGS